jgi:hypothetical protein
MSPFASKRAGPEDLWSKRAGSYGGYCLPAGPNPPAGPVIPALSMKRLRGPLCNHRVLRERITVDRLQEEKAAVRIRGQVRSHSEWVRKEVKKSLAGC